MGAGCGRWCGGTYGRLELVDNQPISPHKRTVGRLDGTDPTIGQFEDIVPKWAYDPHVKKLSEQEEFQPMVPMGLCTGPGVVMARRAIGVLWLSLILITMFAFAHGDCTKTGEKMAYLPAWIWALWIPTFATTAYVEFQCVKLTSIPFAQTVRYFKVLKMTLPFSLWLPCCMCLSMVQRLDLASDGFFAATALSNPYCKGEQLDNLWRYVMRKSTLAHFKLDQVPFEVLVGVSFAVMFVQVIYAWLQTTPKLCSGERVDYVIGAKRADGTDAVVSFNNILTGEKMNFGDSLHILAEPLGAIAITSQKPAFPEKKAMWMLHTEMTVSDIKRILSFVKNTLTQGIVLLGTVALLENAIQVNLQVSTFAMKRAFATDSLMQWHWSSTLLSIALSLVMAVEKIKLGGDFINFANHIVKEVGNIQVSDGSASEFEDDLRSAKRYTRILMANTVLLVLLIAYAVAKFIAVFTCKHSLWNINGCVNLDGYNFQQ